jgi:hypothetical protein
MIWADLDATSVHLLQVQLGFKGDRVRKLNQFAIVFHLLQNGRPMLEYESLKELFMFLKMPNFSKKHWGDNYGWLIAEYLHKQVMVKSREVLSAAKYLAITCDEVTTVDNQSWISIHAYCMQDFYHQPILISLECLTEGASATRLAIIIVDAMLNHGGQTKDELRQKFVSFGADGAVVFQVKILTSCYFNFLLLVMLVFTLM